MIDRGKDGSMKKKDFILIVCILAAALLSGCWFFFTSKEAQEVLITVDGKEWGRYSLNQDRHIEINGTNKLVIEDGKAWMESADCPDQICVGQKAVSRSGEAIVCLPNQIVVTVNGGPENDLDGITG